MGQLHGLSARRHARGGREHPGDPRCRPIDGYRCGASDSCLTLDTTQLSTSSTDTLTIYNTGCDTLVVSNITNSLSTFTLDTTNFTLDPFDSIDVEVTFTPVSAGTFLDSATTGESAGAADTALFHHNHDTSSLSLCPCYCCCRLSCCLVIPMLCLSSSRHEHQGD